MPSPAQILETHQSFAHPQGWPLADREAAINKMCEDEPRPEPTTGLTIPKKSVKLAEVAGRIFTAKIIANHWKLSIATIYKLMRSGKLVTFNRFYAAGQKRPKRYVSEESLKTFLSSNFCPLNRS